MDPTRKMGFYKGIARLSFADYIEMVVRKYRESKRPLEGLGTFGAAG